MDEDQKANPNPTPMETHWAVVALDKAHQELEEKDAEIARLRKALADILHLGRDPKASYWALYNHAQKIARETLKEE